MEKRVAVCRKALFSIMAEAATFEDIGAIDANRYRNLPFDHLFSFVCNYIHMILFLICAGIFSIFSPTTRNLSSQPGEVLLQGSCPSTTHQ